MKRQLLEEAVARVIRKARMLGRPAGISVRLPSEEKLDAPGLFELASRRGQERFYAARPRSGFQWLGLGRAFSAIAHGSDALSTLRTEIEGLRADWIGDVDEVRFLGNAAFRPLDPAGHSPAWRSFGSARFVVPFLFWRQEGNSQTLTLSMMAEPDDNPRERLDGVEAALEATLEKLPEATPQEAPMRRQRVLEAPGFEAAAKQVVTAIRRGRAEKVVLAGAVDLELQHALSMARVLRDLTREHPAALTFALGHDESTFLGATPEVLVARQGLDLHASAIAGTARRHSDPELDAASAERLLASGKDAVEHKLVVDGVRAALDPLAALHPVTPPTLLDAGPIRHLYTPVCGRLHEPKHLLELAAELHPTPALGGVPQKAALDLINEVEPFDRGGYGGPVGGFGFDGCGEFHVALRCALVRGRKARLYAGSGLVADSCPAAEALETADKLRTLGDWLEAP